MIFKEDDMRKLWFLSAAAVLALASCDRKIEEDTVPSAVSIEPVITRALSLNFNEGDRIGLDIVMADGTAYAENACLTYAEAAFSGDLLWYKDGGVTSTLFAYYPYGETGFPTSFTVAADQTSGTESSDLIVAAKAGVRPSYSPELMAFRHQFAQIVVNIDNPAGIPVKGVTVRGLIPTAIITRNADATVTASVDAGASAVDIKAEQLAADAKFCAVVVPQSFASLGIILDVNVEGAASIITGVGAAELKAGYSYPVNIKLEPGQVSASISGEITGWEEGDPLNGGDYEPSFEEGDGFFVYDGQRYNTVTLDNGQTWMAEPLAYVPFGKTVSDTPGDGSRYYYPYGFSEVNTIETFKADGITHSGWKKEGTVAVLKDAASIKAKGYLYTTEGYLNAALTEENFTAFEGAQGVCPKGWHIPSRAEWLELFGNALAGKNAGYPAVDDPTALFYEKDYKGGRVTNVNSASGLNLTLDGQISITTFASYGVLALSEYNSTAGSYFDKPAMTTYACSTASSLATDKTLMYFGLATTFSLAAYPEGRLSLMGSKVDNAVQVRCIKNAAVTE